MSVKFKGVPYPVVKHPLGLFRIESGVNQIKADLLQLLLTNPRERVMLPEFGTPLKDLIFEPNDTEVARLAREMILRSIASFEPRISVDAVEVSVINSSDPNDLAVLDSADDLTNVDHILYIKILFRDPEQIEEINELDLKLPIGG